MATATKSRNIFVLGEDSFNEQHHLRPLSHAYGFNFHCLTEWHESRIEDRPVMETLEMARRRLESFDDTIDGLITFYDFPVSLIAPILCREFNLPAPSVESVLKCEHKYWGRLMQREAAPDVVPAFSRLNPTDDAAEQWGRLADEGFQPPFWIKPVKGVLGQLAYKINSRDEFLSAIDEVREQGDRFARPLGDLLKFLDIKMPEGLSHEAAAQLFLVEENIEVPLGCTLEGHRFGGVTHSHGIVDSYRYPGKTAFHRFYYPSKLPESVQQRMERASAAVMETIDYDNGAFNIEFFWDPADDSLRLLEINPRISQSHSPQFHMVDGDANMKIIADLALGTKPHLVHRQGEHKVAAKLMLRIFANDGTVTRSPGEADCEAVRQRFPGTLIRPTVHIGQRLSEQKHADNYSWELAEIYMGARNEEELLTHFNQAIKILDFRVDGKPVEVPSPQEAIVEWETPS